VLLGRERESVEIDSALELARNGSGGVLLVRGDPGIGKSALLARSVADADGMLVLQAQGFETGAEIGYTILADLCRPLAGDIEKLPARLRAALSGAIGPDPRVLSAWSGVGPEGRGEVGGAFAVGRALTTALQSAGARGPVLIALDDGHWADEASVNVLLFALRRVASAPVALVVTLRNGEASGFDTLEAPTLELGGLARDAAEALIGEEVREYVGDRVCEHIHRAAKGNPLALLELSEAAIEGYLDPDEDVVPAGPRLVRAFGARLDRLPAPTSLALMVVAASFTGDVAETRGALDRLGMSEFELDLARVEGLVWLEGDRWQLRHPIFRSVAYQRHPVDERRRVHRAFAAWLADNGGGKGGIRADERAWHAAAAALPGDEEAVALLMDVVEAARNRGALAAARRAALRARELTTDPEIRALMSIGAAECAQLSGEVEDALALIADAVAVSDDPAVASTANRLRHTITLARSGADEVLELFEADAAELVEHGDPDLAAAILGSAAATAVTATRLADTLRLAERGTRLALGPTSQGGVGARTMYAYGLISAGRAREAADVVAEYFPAFRESDPWRYGFEAVGVTGMLLVWLGRHQDAEEYLARQARVLRTAGAEEHLPLLLVSRALLALRTGDWDAAEEAVEESRILGSELGQWQVAPLAVALAARLAAVRGDDDLTHTMATTADQLTETTGATFYRDIAHTAVGSSHLAWKRPGEAVATLERVRARMLGGGLVENSLFAPTFGDYVEALLRSGERTRAQAMVAAELPRAEAGGLAATLAVVYRCRAQVAVGGDAGIWYAKAFQCHGHSPDVYELARSHLAYGRTLRESGATAEALVALRRAADRFAALGSSPWLAEAQDELGQLLGG
jgi:tetratricopeptide (TPR) repeat protein